MAKNIAQTVEKLALPIAEQLGLEIWDVEFVKEGTDWFLRVYIDKPDGITTDDCELFSRTFDPILDREDPIDKSYCFEVSSPGIERLLTKPAHYERFMGEQLRLSLYKAVDGKKEIIGKLVAYGDEITVEVNGAEININKKNCAAVRLCANGGVKNG